MSVSQLPSFTSNACHYHIGATVDDPKSYRCHLSIVRESDGSFSAVVLNLPGVGSCGDTEEDAVRNAKMAAKETIQSFVDDGEAIPWTDKYDVPEGGKLKLVLVE